MPSSSSIPSKFIGSKTRQYLFGVSNFFCEAEICQFELASYFGGVEEVLWFEVSMRDVHPVKEGKSLADLMHHLGSLSLGEGILPAVLNMLSETKANVGGVSTLCRARLRIR